MGDAKSGPIRLSFNPQLRVEFRGATVTSDAGLLLPRDPRTGRNSQFPLRDLFRQSIYSRLAGYEDTNDAERLAEDPTFRMLASRERRGSSVALTSTLHWLETDVLDERACDDGAMLRALAPQEWVVSMVRTVVEPRRNPLGPGSPGRNAG